MGIIKIEDLNDFTDVGAREAEMVKGGPIEIRELTIKVSVKTEP